MWLQELEDVEESLKTEQEASLDERHSKGSGESQAISIYSFSFRMFHNRNLLICLSGPSRGDRW